MKSLYYNHHFQGIMIFSHKKHWKNILNFLEKTIGKKQFFFFFDSERGYHLKIISNNFSTNELKKISLFLSTLPFSENSLPEDPLFLNVPENTLHSIQYISKSADILYSDNLPTATISDFLNQLGYVVIDALRYNDFFLEEKNRINFAIQLIFLALVKADRHKIQTELESFLPKQHNEIESNSPLIRFYNDVKEIEKEGNMELWVKDWLESSKNFLKKAHFSTMVTSICTLLEIRTFETKLLYTTQAVLLH